jgi:hypothetical protein
MKHSGWITMAAVGWLSGAAALMASAPSALAADPTAGIAQHARTVDDAARTPAGEQRVVSRLAADLGVPESTLRAQRAQSKLGWGELSIAYRLAQRTGTPVNQIIAEHKAGKGWGVIAQEHDVKLGKVVSDANKSSRALSASSGRASEDHSSSTRASTNFGGPGPGASAPGHGASASANAGGHGGGAGGGSGGGGGGGTGGGGGGGGHGR